MLRRDSNIGTTKIQQHKKNCNYVKTGLPPKVHPKSQIYVEESV